MEQTSENFLPIYERHPLPPFLPRSARLLMLGSFPPPRKRWCMDFFYPNWSNDMWRIWGLIYKNDPGAFIDPERKCFKQDELTVFLEGVGVALYDTAQAVLRKMANASDKYLDIQQRTDITQLLENLPLCRAIAATGQKACETLGETLCLPHLPAIGQWVPFNYSGHTLRCYRMPSTSRAYPLPLAKKAGSYARMLEELDMLPALDNNQPAYDL